MGGTPGIVPRKISDPSTSPPETHRRACDPPSPGHIGGEARGGGCCCSGAPEAQANESMDINASLIYDSIDENDFLAFPFPAFLPKTYSLQSSFLSLFYLGCKSSALISMSGVFWRFSPFPLFPSRKLSRGNTEKHLPCSCADYVYYYESIHQAQPLFWMRRRARSPGPLCHAGSLEHYLRSWRMNASLL